MLPVQLRYQMTVLDDNISNLYLRGFSSSPFGPLTIPFRNLCLSLSRSQMDAFFISHGLSMMSIDWQSWRAKVLQLKPKAILVVSAHWDTALPTLNAVDRNDTIHDFYGFLKPMYQVLYL